MHTYKQDFIDFMLTAGGLRFGDFVTKSGRNTPYFINSGSYCTGQLSGRLGEYYAHALIDRLGQDFDNLFGPAYKGIPLVTATSGALWHKHQHPVSFTFNRKEAKDHGEKGVFVGHKYEDGDRVVIVEDVITAGTSIRETLPLLQAAAQITLAGVVVSVDRQERGTGECSALAEIAESTGAPVFAIVTLTEIVDYLSGKGALDADTLDRITAYRAEFGASQQF
jgi:orotate phosphoribosyltransferase